MEFHSTLKETPISETCVIYDKRDGRIILVHEFIGDGTGLYGPQGKDERARIALEAARHNRDSSEALQVLHLERNFQPAPNTLYRVDVAGAKLESRRQMPNAVAAPSSPGRSRAQ
jgi:hypothetical protein